jgi:hypothetical protein
LGFQASASAGNALSEAGARGTVIAAAPDMRYVMEALNLMDAQRLLLILPKWTWRKDPDKPEWVEGVEPMPLISVQETLALAAADNLVYRAKWPKSWPVNEIGYNPSGSGVVQLIRPGRARAVVGDGEGVLVAEIIRDGAKIWILSDPDVMSNHGIGKGDNAPFMIALVDALRRWENDDPSAPIVFGETVHGFREGENSPFWILFRFPFSIVTILTCCSAALFALSGASRFGKPRAPESHLAFGKAKLIDNSARLLDYGGHHAIVLSRYVRMTIRSVARSLHAPDDLDEPALAEWLDTVGRARGAERSCGDILLGSLNSPRLPGDRSETEEERVSRLFKSAIAINSWKGEILNGPAVRRRNR